LATAIALTNKAAKAGRANAMCVRRRTAAYKDTHQKSVELANKACAHLLMAPTDATDTTIKTCAHLLITLINVTKANLFMYNITAKSCYIFIVFIRIIVNTGVSKKFIISYRQFQAL
jgi:hypothetical protein